MFTRRLLPAATTVLLLLQLGTPAFGEQRGETGSWPRDPFRYKETPPMVGADELAEAEPLTGDLLLKGVILGKDGRYRALINNREYRAGDSFEGISIRQVTRFGIVVEDADGTRKIDLFHD